QLDGTPAVVAEVASASASVLFSRHPGELSITRIRHVWIASKGSVPLQVVDSLRYKFYGWEFPCERSSPCTPRILKYGPADIVEFGNGIFFPRSGSEEHYAPDPATEPPFDADKLVDRLISGGKYTATTRYPLSTRREWRVIHLSPIPSGSQLWFEPPI